MIKIIKMEQDIKDMRVIEMKDRSMKDIIKTMKRVKSIISLKATEKKK